MLNCTENIIQIQSLVKTYKGKSTPALNGISLTVSKTEIFGLLGPNGAGKTTALSILCGLLKQSAGQIKICGYDISSELKRIKQILGFVPQEIALYPQLTAKENLMFFGRIYGLKGKQLKEVIKYYLEKFSLTESADKRVSTFSGGMKRRVNIIAGLLHSPEILILDEPTAGVDVQSRNLIIEEIKELNSNGITVIYTSHYLEEAQNLCSRFAIIDFGNIIYSKTMIEFIAENPTKTLEEKFLLLTGRELRD